MEGILGFIVIIVGWIIFRWVLGQAAAGAVATTKAAYKTATGSGDSFSDNFRNEWQGMGSFEIRLRDGVLKQGSGTKTKKIEARGLFPVGRNMSGGIVITARDTTGSDAAPVFTFFEAIQEDETIALRIEHELGMLREGYGISEWVEIGQILPEVLYPPHSGQREITLLVYLIDADNSPPSRLGYIDLEHPGVVWAGTKEFNHTFTDVGYAEASENRDECLKHTITVAMAVAMADGSLDDSEGFAIKKWIEKLLSSIDDPENREEKRVICNEALRQAHADAKSGTLSVQTCTDQLNDLGQKSAKYETIKLCYDVMAADGVADPSELKLIKSIAEQLGLDFKEVESLRDSAVLKLTAPTSEQASLEDILGIDPSWDKRKKQQHIEDEFVKWNGRLSALRDPDQRAQAQRMIDLCGEAAEKYD